MSEELQKVLCFSVKPTDSFLYEVPEVLLKCSKCAILNLLIFVTFFSIEVCVRLNAAKCSTMCVAPSKKKAAAGYPHCSPNINSCPIPWVHSVKIRDVFFTNDLDWRQHGKSVRITMSRKLAVLCRIGSLLHT